MQTQKYTKLVAIGATVIAVLAGIVLVVKKAREIKAASSEQSTNE
jgi:hypothetical protein